MSQRDVKLDSLLKVSQVLRPSDSFVPLSHVPSGGVPLLCARSAVEMTGAEVLGFDLDELGFQLVADGQLLVAAA